MSAFTVIRLDTTPPVVTWGPVTDANATELMTVLYAVDELGMVSAELKLTDNRIVPATVYEDRVTVQIPDDAPEAVATLSALLRDDVGNEDTATLNIYVSGGTPVEPFTPTPGPPVLPVETPWRTRSRCETRSRWSVLHNAQLRSRANLVTRTRVRRDVVRLRPPSVAHVRSGGAVRTHLGSRSTLLPGEKWTLTKRPEGRGTEDDLVLLGIL
jgi:hypothetical protein